VSRSQSGSTVGPVVGRLLSALLFCASAAAIAAADERPFDLVLANGRVIDPASGTDGIRHIGILDGRIADVSETPLRGDEVIDATGLVVAPGFIDLHAHGQNPFSARLQALDGVTTALELELGVYPVAPWYAAREHKSVINYGASVGHPSARVSVMHGIDLGAIEAAASFGGSAISRMPRVPPRPARWADEATTVDELDALQNKLQQGLDDGALGIGFGLAYTPAASREEIWRSFAVAARNSVLTYVHLRHSGDVEPGSGIGALQEVIASAATTGAGLHVAHIATTARRNVPLALEMLDSARKRGVDVSTEVYPWEAAETGIGSAIFDEGWQQRTGATFADLEWSATGERLTEETFRRYRKEQPSGSVIAHIIPAEAVDYAMSHPHIIVVSDGPAYVLGRGHPRGAGSFSRTLGHYVRDRKVLGLMGALAKMTVLPADRLRSFVPDMARKGRVQPGADADITVFDPERVGERATYRDPVRPSAGIGHVIVGGSFIVKDSAFVEGAYPGRPVRRTTKAHP